MSYKNQEIKIFENADKLAEEFSLEFISIINLLSKDKEKINVSLSGGNTPKLIFQKVIPHKKKINWQKIYLFWGDERCVPPEDNESNYRMAKKHLLDHINIPLGNVKRIYGENNPEEEAKRYSQEIKNNLQEVNGLPSFDIMILGLGEDGHTASIFPDQIELLGSKNICEVAHHPLTMQKRVTLTGKVINNSEKIFFLVSGKNKSHVVSEILNEKKDFLKYPAYYIKPYGGSVVWFLDKKAASELN